MPDSLLSRDRRSASQGSRCKTNLKFALLQEQIHRQIASELHDSTCQHLVAASLGLMQIKNAFDDPLAVERHCEQVNVSIDRALQELRTLTYLMHPQGLSEDGLKMTIERYVEEFSTRTSLVVEVSIARAVDNLPYETQRSVLRIVQEALTNVCRHAKATKVGVTIAARGRNFSLEVRDDGQGMIAGRSPCRSRAPAAGTGLRIMRARLQEMGGRLEISSAPAPLGHGTVLRAVFPSTGASEGRERDSRSRSSEQPAYP